MVGDVSPIQRLTSASGTPPAAAGPLIGAGASAASGSAWASTSAEQPRTAPPTIPILDGLAARALQTPGVTAGAEAFAWPVLARMSTAEFGILGGSGSPSGESEPQGGGGPWSGMGAGVFAGQGGASWAAAGGMLHQVQRSTRGSTSLGSHAGVSIPSSGRAISIARITAAGAAQGAVYGGSDQPARFPSTLPDGIGSGRSPSLGLGARGAASVQRATAYSTAAPGVMSWRGQGHGLAAMTGGLAARALPAAVIQRLATGALSSGGRPGSAAGTGMGGTSAGQLGGSPGTAESLVARRRVGGFQPPQGIGAPGSAGSLPGTVRSLVVQRFATGGFATGESGSAAQAAPMLARMTPGGDGASTWSDGAAAWGGSWPAGTLADSAGGLAGAAGGLVARIQRMVPGGEPVGSVGSVG
ncbi:MAG: hypothetical protein ACRDGS_00125, partial [Chloroflexota bacterium]